MRIFIGICHPKDVHFWKHVIHNLEKDGHEVRILAWDKDVTLYLLDTYGFDYEVIGKSYKNFLMKFYDMLRSDVKVLKAAMKFKPDLFIHGDPYLAHVSTITGKYHIEYCDTDHAKLIHLTTFPFSDVICTPASFNKEVDPKKHLTFNGYSELAYLHPAYFKPNPSVLDELGLKMGERFIVMRFVAWGASHDVNQQGFNSKEEIVEGLEKYGRVFIVSEKELDESLEKYRISIPAQKVHDLLYYATLYIGEGATMASEAAILGTPSIYINTLRLGYTDEEENEYGLLYNFSDPENMQPKGLSKAIELLEMEDVKGQWQEKRKRLIEEKIDVTGFLTELIEKSPVHKN